MNNNTQQTIIGTYQSIKNTFEQMVDARIQLYGESFCKKHWGLIQPHIFFDMGDLGVSNAITATSYWLFNTPKVYKPEDAMDACLSTCFPYQTPTIQILHAVFHIYRKLISLASQHAESRAEQPPLLEDVCDAELAIKLQVECFIVMTRLASSENDPYNHALVCWISLLRKAAFEVIPVEEASKEYERLIEAATPTTTIYGTLYAGFLKVLEKSGTNMEHMRLEQWMKRFTSVAIPKKNEYITEHNIPALNPEVYAGSIDPALFDKDELFRCMKTWIQIRPFDIIGIDINEICSLDELAQSFPGSLALKILSHSPYQRLI